MAHRPDEDPREAFVLEADFEATEGTWHSHRRAQLVHAGDGVIVVTTRGTTRGTRDGRWVAPPQRAVWIPAGVEHRVASKRRYTLLSLYVEPGFVPLPSEPRVVAVDTLVEELLRAAAKHRRDAPSGGPEDRLVRVILDRLPALETAPLFHLPDAKSPELRKITQALAKDPSDARTLSELAREMGASARTAARKFLAETGLTFGQWRTQLRLFAALERLAAGSSVTAVAFEVGYTDVSSFIAAFKAATGETPARYFGDVSAAAASPRRRRG
ncbi:MAG: helix-turn-helix transcriptional regulator [Deltaproteobacteria bacterium]|nr:helix-turn-helix transcriptional regulator [Deltaproteobacteria bacterium]